MNEKTDTAGHLIAGLVYRAYNAKVLGTKGEGRKGRIEFELENFDSEELKQFVERGVQELMKNDSIVREKEIPVQEAKDFHATMQYQKLEGEKVRVVEISGFDYQACQGKHVKSLKEIGKIKILGLKKNNAWILEYET